MRGVRVQGIGFCGHWVSRCLEPRVRFLELGVTFDLNFLAQRSIQGIIENRVCLKEPMFLSSQAEPLGLTLLPLRPLGFRVWGLGTGFRRRV